MPYISLYRKYRPQTFDDVVGQEHVTTTLRNAVSAGRIASGYLFCGTRGTAKTTCARILAKALNCIGPDGTRTAMSPDPCGVCEPCRSIASSAFVDVLEMDAASHGKVDDVRDLVASIKFPPLEGRYKVYIIDEAHQLSRDAMDAFLKTLEEPPDRVVFVLATTELEKLPITIASRCQVFEFKRGSVAQIAGRLTKVLADEGVAAEPMAVTLVARAAEGSYRDSLSLLEQVLAFKPDQIASADVTNVLGAVDEDVLNRIVDVVASGDAAGAFSVVAGLLTAGKDVRQVLRTLSERFRDLLALRVGAHSKDTEVLQTDSMAAQAKRFQPSMLLRILAILSEAERDVRWNTQHRLLLETTLLRLMEIPDTAPAQRNGTEMPAAAPTPRPASTSSVVDTRPQSAAQPQPTVTSVAAPTQVQPTVASHPVVAPPVAAQRPAPPSAAPFDMDDEDDLDDTDSEPEIDLDSLPIVKAAPRPAPPVEDDLLTVQQVAVAPVAAPAPPPRPVAPAGSHPDLLKLQRSWQEVINRFSSRSPSGAPIARDAKVTSLDGNAFILSFSSRFHIDRLEKNDKGRKALEEIINKTLDVTPGTYRIRSVMAGQEPPPSPSSAYAAPPPAPMPVRAAPEPLPAAPNSYDDESDLVEDVIAVFGGRILEDDTKG